MFKEHFSKSFSSPEEGTYQTVKKALELGLNFFDTAEAYGEGESEIDFGKALKKIGVNREDIVVSAKIFLGTKGFSGNVGVNAKGLSRKHVLEGIDGSLKRLQLDYVDIAYCHRYDYETPLEEVCRAFHSVIEKGKAFYWGTSEWSSTQIAEAIAICERLNLHKPIVEQPQYNMFHRQRFEVEYAPIFEKYGYGTTVWGPLAGGLLTGRYLKDAENAGRVSNYPPAWKNMLHFDEYFAPEKLERTKKMFEGLEEIAKGLGGTISQLAVAWILRNKDVSTAILGFSSVEQLEENFKAIELYKKFTPEIDNKLEELLGNRPNPGMDWKNGKPLSSRR